MQRMSRAAYSRSMTDRFRENSPELALDLKIIVRNVDNFRCAVRMRVAGPMQHAANQRTPDFACMLCRNASVVLRCTKRPQGALPNGLWRISAGCAVGANRVGISSRTSHVLRYRSAY